MAYLHNSPHVVNQRSSTSIESSDYLFTGGLLRGTARTAAFPVSACLPSAGGGVFKIQPSTSSKDHRSESQTTYHQRRAVFVKTSRDACDGSTWNSGILREDPKLKLARDLRNLSYQRQQQELKQSREGVRSSESGGSPNVGHLRNRLASVYKKQHLEEVLGSMDISDQLERERELAAAEEAAAAAAAREAQEKQLLRENRMSVAMVEKMAAAAPSVSTFHNVHRLRDRGGSFMTSDGALLRTKVSTLDFANALLSEPATSSTDLLSSLTGSSPGPVQSPPYKSVSSLGNGLPPHRPDSSTQRGWENVKTALFEKSARRTSWADLNRDTDYIKKYDANAIPGLEVQVGTIRCQRRPKPDF